MNPKAGVSRKQSMQNFPKNEHFFSPDTHTFFHLILKMLPRGQLSYYRVSFRLSTLILGTKKERASKISSQKLLYIIQYNCLRKGFFLENICCNIYTVLTFCCVSICQEHRRVCQFLVFILVT